MGSIRKMNNFLLSVRDKSYKTENLLIKCLEKAGFEVIGTKNGILNVNLAEDKLSNQKKSERLNTQKFIFPSIPKLSKVFDFIELNYHQSIRLKEVAQAVGYSSAYLTDLVRRMTEKTVNGSNIQQWDCHGGDNQRWILTPLSDGSYRIDSKHSGKCIDLALSEGGQTFNGSNILQWDWHGGDNQRWILTPSS